MKKNPRKKRKNKIADVLIIVILMILLVDVLMIWMIRERKTFSEDSAEQTQQLEPTRLQEDTVSQLTPRQTVPDETSGPDWDVIEFPIVLENGSLTVFSMFQYSGLNPDCSDQDGTDIAGIMIENTSSSHLTWAQLEITTDDGRLLHFAVSDIPAGRSAMVFSQENASIKVNTACVGINCEAEFQNETSLMTDLVEFTVTETGFTVSNISGVDLYDLNIHCHGVLETDYYGGTTYRYYISELPAGKKYEIDTLNEFFGMMEIVRVEAISE